MEFDLDSVTHSQESLPSNLILKEKVANRNPSSNINDFKRAWSMTLVYFRSKPDLSQVRQSDIFESL